MEWKGRRESTNVEDRRGLPVGRTAMVGGGLGTLVLALVVMFLGGDPTAILQTATQGAQEAPASGPAQPYQETSAEADRRRFVAVVLADTEDVWTAVFSAAGRRYEDPTLVLYSGATQTACGVGEAAMGPFYCPADRKVYIDLSFYDTLRERLGAPGDFAQAYVIAHEVGHHLQNLMGTSAKLDQARGRVSEREMNALSVRLELQADCFAGVWAQLSQRSKGWLEQGDVEEALNAAAQIGDDTLQKRARGTVVPESFTHGSSAQRVRWFKRGLEAGELRACDTFGSNTL